jgi:hypothetical protein
MPRLTLLSLGTVAGLLLAAPAGAAVTPKTLPAVAKTLTTKGAACTSTAYRAPLAGFLDVRLRGSGDWDLELRDVAGRTLGASRAFGGREVVQTRVRAGQRVTAVGCRRSAGAGRSARTTFRLTSVTLPKLVGALQMLRVRGDEKQLHALEAAGLDVTHARGRGWADVLVAGATDLAKVVASGLRYSIRIGDLTKSLRDARAADRRYATRVGAAGSALPTGRTTYRTYEEVQSELKGLVDDNPGLVRKVVFGTSFQGREISGVEISKNVDQPDGRPVYFLMAVHHAREWPAMEAAMEFAHMLVQEQGDSRIAGLLATERVVILPLVNPDGFVSTRNAFDIGDQLGQQPDVTLVESIAPFGGQFAYRRKNCNGEIFPPSLPCELAWGVDPNRNYGYNWGGAGSSADVTSQSYHGPAPRSESEVKAVWNFVRTHEVTTLITLHNVAALVLRPPGTSGAGQAPDEAKLKAVGDRMGAAAGYTSQYGFELYDTSGTTEDDSYAATGGFGYTIEIGPPDGNFHMPYETGVVAEWTGANAHSNNQGGLKEALLIAAGAAADPADHAILKGTAAAGKVLRLHKAFETKTSPWCSKSVDPVLTVEALENLGLGEICLTGKQPPLSIGDELDARTTVPASGSYEWHIGPSTRPFVAAGGGKEAYELTCEQADGTVLERHDLVVDRGQTAVVNLACGSGSSTFADGSPLGGKTSAQPGSVATPSVDGSTAPPPPAAPAERPVATRAQKLASCNKKANKIKAAKQRAAAKRSCTKRFGKQKPAATKA